MVSNLHLGSLTVNPSVRLLLLTPTPPPEGEDEGPRSLRGLPYLAPSTRVDVAWCADAPSVYERREDVNRATPLIVERARWAEAQGYHAMVVGCMVDPGVAEASRAVRMPVIGLGAATRAIAGLLGQIPATFYPGRTPVLDLAEDGEETYRKMVEAGRRRIRAGGADVLVPECAYLGRLAPRLQEELGVPVLPNADIGLRAAETIAVFGLLRRAECVDRSLPRRLLASLYRLVSRTHHRMAQSLPRRRPQ